MTAAVDFRRPDISGLPVLQHKPVHQFVRKSANTLQVVSSPAMSPSSSSLHPKDAMESQGMYATKSGKVFRNPLRERDEHRARIAEALRLALNSGQFTKHEIIEVAQIDRKTLDNWLNEHCDPTSWRLASVGRLLGPWFFMHIFGGDIGRAMFERMQARVADASSQESMETDLQHVADELVGSKAMEG